MPKIRVIDLSHHNVIPSSLKPAREAGVAGVIHKATEGKSYRDDTLAARAYLSADAGMLFGVYHFLRPGDMKQQANFFVETTVKAIKDCYTPEQLIYAADHEDAGVSLDDLKKFLTEVETLTGRIPIIYSGNVLKEQLPADGDEEISFYPLWLAQYANTPILPVGFDSYFLWQYTDGQHGPNPKSVPGVNPPVDCNDYRGTDAELGVAWLGGSPQPAPAIEITVTVPAGTIVRIVET